MNRVASVMSAAILFAAGSLVIAQEPSARERELEDLVRRLSERVDQLESRLSRIEGRLNGARRWQAGTMSGSAFGGAGVLWALQKVTELMSR